MALELVSKLLAEGAKAHRVSSTPEMKEGKWHTLFECEGAGVITHLWFTFPPEDMHLGRRSLVRMYWDGEKNPSVEAPLTDFFGIPFGHTGRQYRISSKYITIAPKNGLNCYFEMPFAKGAKIEILPEQIESGGGFYFQADYCAFADGLPERYGKQRFHAQFRFENPAENYGRNYLWLDATGRGAVVGMTLGVETREPQADSWYHGGGDMILVDGEEGASALHGIGAEDFFGHSWGVEEFSAPYIGTPLQERDRNGKIRRVALYRFFDRDPVPFEKSARCIIGALANAYSSVAYWYQEEPHKVFFRTPKADKRMPWSQARYGTYDVRAKAADEWRLLAPFKITGEEPFEKARALERRETGRERFVYEATGERATLPGGDRIAVRWRKVSAHHGWVDFHEVARPATKYIKLQTGVAGYAVKYITSSRARDVRIRVAFDDEMMVSVNGKQVFCGRHESGIAEETFAAHFKRGRNRVLVKLSNEANTTWRLWAFTLSVE